MTAKDYAQALYQLKSPDMARVRTALRRRGHEKLLPAVYREYQKLGLQKERAAAHRQTTAAKEETRVLLELYRKLTA